MWIPSLSRRADQGAAGSLAQPGRDCGQPGEMRAVSEYWSTDYSRFQVLSEGQPAWAQDDHGSVYQFDGLHFWKLTRRGKSRLVTSWQSPTFGWEHESQCSCHLCDSRCGQRHVLARETCAAGAVRYGLKGMPGRTDN